MKTLLRRYQGSIKALSRLYEDSIEALLRLYEDSIEHVLMRGHPHQLGLSSASPRAASSRAPSRSSFALLLEAEAQRI